MEGKNMTHRVVITTKAEIELSMDLVAQWFCELTDEAQAAFFIAVAECAESWTLGAPSEQWYLVGRHLFDCACSTDAARDLIYHIAKGIKAAERQR